MPRERYKPEEIHVVPKFEDVQENTQDNTVEKEIDRAKIIKEMKLTQKLMDANDDAKIDEIRKRINKESEQ